MLLSTNLKKTILILFQALVPLMKQNTEVYMTDSTDVKIVKFDKTSLADFLGEGDLWKIFCQ